MNNKKIFQSFGYGQLAVILLSIIVLVPIWIAKFVPNQNGPQYLLEIDAVKNYLNPSHDYSVNHDIIFLLIPNLLSQLFVYLFTFLFPLLISYKIVLSFIIVLFPVSVFYFIDAIDSKKFMFGFISFLYVYNHFLLKGYDNFFLSFSLFLFYFGYLVKNISRLRAKEWAVLTLLATLLYFAHIFTFLLALLISALFILYDKNRKGNLLKVVSSFSPGLLCFLQYLFWLKTNNVEAFGGRVIYYSPFHWTVQYFLEMTMYSYSNILVLLFWIPLAFIVFGVIKKLIAIKNKYLKKDKMLNVSLVKFLGEEPLTIVLALLMVAFFVVPREIIGWGKFNIRFIPFILFFSLVNATPLKNEWMKRVFLTITVLITVLIVSLIAMDVKEINKEISDYTSGIAVVEEHKTLLPVHFEDYRVGMIRPLHWVFNYYTIFKGITTWKNSIFVFPGRGLVKYKKPIEIPPDGRIGAVDPKEFENLDLAKIGEQYNYILIWGEYEGKENVFKSNGYELIHQQGKLRLRLYEQF